VLTIVCLLEPQIIQTYDPITLTCTCNPNTPSTSHSLCNPHPNPQPHPTRRTKGNPTPPSVPVLQLHNLRKFVPHNSRLRPAYFIAVDHRARAIIWGERRVWCVGGGIGVTQGGLPPIGVACLGWAVHVMGKGVQEADKLRRHLFVPTTAS
jgi:hypothetical protein